LNGICHLLVQQILSVNNFISNEILLLIFSAEMPYEMLDCKNVLNFLTDTVTVYYYLWHICFRKRRGGVFWKLLGLSIVSAGGVIGYAWYDKEFKKIVEDNVPYSNEAFSYIFEYLPESLPNLPSLPSLPSFIQEKP